MVVGTYNGGYKVKGGEIALSINEQDASTRILLEADVIDIEDLLSAIAGEGITCTDLTCVGSVSVDQNIDCEGSITGYTVIAENGVEIQGGLLDCYDIDCADIDAANLKVPDGALTVGADAASWKSTTIPVLTYSQQHSWVYRSGGNDYTFIGYAIGTHTTKTIDYLGK